jgi:hypothetical protein
VICNAFKLEKVSLFGFWGPKKGLLAKGQNKTAFL